jgi:glycosyltransferase involved in cell wall biosynthesis
MGSARFIYEVCKRLVKRAEVDVFSEVSSPQIRDIYRNIGIEINDLLGISSNKSRYWLFFPWYLRKLIHNTRPLVKDYDVFLPFFFPFNYVSAELGKPTVFYCFEPYAFFYSSDIIRGLSLPMKAFASFGIPLYSKYDISGTRRVNRVLTQSLLCVDEIRKIYGRDAEVVYEGVDTGFFRRRNNTGLLEKYNGKKIILYVTSGFADYKGTETLLKVLPRVAEKNPNIKLLITCANEKGKRRLVELSTRLKVRSLIDFLGFVPEELLPDYYSLANVVVSLSLISSTSLPLKEAMACETPVVGYRSTGAEEDIGKNELCGFLVNRESLEELASAITMILENSDVEHKMGKAGRRRVETLFTWDMTVDGIWNSIQNA